jgi:predicted phage terminase large subunit-like protein
MVFMPPRHGKSELASKSFPAWCIGLRPDMQILAASYNGDIASDFGRAVRNIVSAPEYQCVFPGITVSVDSAAADKWHTNKGGVYFAAGIGTAATGRGADLLIIDDPVKGRQEADSEIERKRTWDWYTSTAYTRLMPNACIALIQTRWHDDDLAGRLLVEADRGGEQWEVLSLPALDDDGRALWPEWYDEAYLANTRQLLGTREFSALYQQKPVPDTGDQFQADWIRLYDDPPATLRVFGASDYAVTESGGDYTVHGVVGVDQHGDLYVLDWWRKQAGPVEWIEAFCALCAKWKPLEWAEEAGQIRGSLDQFIVKRMKELGTTTYRKAYPSVVDKVNRAQSIIGMMSMGRVYFPRRALWTDGLVHELLRFPSGTSDDQVDVLGLFGRMLLRMGAAQKPAPPPEPMKLLQTMTLNELWQAHDQHRGSRTRI